MATPLDEIPIAHLPLDVLRRQIDGGQNRGYAGATSAEAPPEADDADDPDLVSLLAEAGLATRTVAGDAQEPLRAELARRLNEGRERARQRAALYRAHLSTGLLQFRARPSRDALERFIHEAGAILQEETGAPPIYLLVPTRLYHTRFTALYDVYGASIRGEPLVLAASFGPLIVTESDLVTAVTLV